MLEIRDLTKVFVSDNNIDKKIALDKINLTINDGEFVTVIGGNGSGKSTLMNIISGSILPDEGQIYLDGELITKLSEHKRAKFLGRVFQDPNMGTATNMSLLENLELAYRRGEKRTLKWGFKKEHEKIFKEKLQKLDLGLENNLNKKIGLFSGGQRQAITLLMATFMTPKLLLLDEHTAALDPKTATKVLKITNEVVTENNITTIMITHNMKDAIKYGNRLIMFNNGHIVFDISGEEKQQLKVQDLLEKFEQFQEDICWKTRWDRYFKVYNFIFANKLIMW